jgi:prophage regulatory protein
MDSTFRGNLVGLGLMNGGPAGAQKLLRLKAVLDMVPVGKSTWYKGIRDGHYPKPIHLSARSVAWDQGEILRLMQRLSSASS